MCRPALDELRADLDAFHGKLAPIKCTPVTLDAEDDKEPALLRASYYRSLPTSERPAFSTDQPQAPEDTCDSGVQSSGAQDTVRLYR